MEAILDIILTIIYALLGFSILVFIHELGHMLVGRAVGIGVEQFSIGFGPAIIKFKIKSILFKLSAIPFGGYCKFKGQEDFGTGQSNAEPDDFYSRPPWARLLAIIAGPVSNILIAIIIFVIIFALPTKELANNTIVVDSQYEEVIELESGDEIIAINGKEVTHSQQIMTTLLNKFEEEITLTVIRDGKQIQVKYTPKFKNLEQNKMEFTIGDTEYPYIARVSEGSPAEKAGIKKGDKILKINDKEINLSSTISEVINKQDKDEVKVTILRNGETKELTMTPIKEGDRKIIGVYPVNIVNPQYNLVKRNLGEAIVRGVEESYNAVWVTIKGLGKLFSGEADIMKNVAGPIGIFTLIGRAGATQPLVDYIRLLGLISVLLGFFNLLPIPAVDGGHIVLTIIEMIRGKPLSMKVIQVVQLIGVVLILTLFVLVAIKDIINLPEMFKMFG